MQNHVWQIQLLGGLTARYLDNAPIALTRQQTGSLFAFLALHPNRAYTREFLMALLWPDDAPEEAAHSLRQALYSLRKQLNVQAGSESDPLITTRNSIELKAAIVSTDVRQFEFHLKAAASSTDVGEHIRSLNCALGCYSDELLPGMYLEEFEPERRSLAELHRGALHSLTLAYEMTGDLTQAIETAKCIVALDPLVEEAYCDLMRLYAAAGKPSSVVRQYQDLVSSLKRELGEEPSAATVQLMESLRQIAQRNAALNGRSLLGTTSQVPTKRGRVAETPVPIVTPDEAGGKLNSKGNRRYSIAVLTSTVCCTALLLVFGAHLRHSADALSSPANSVKNANLIKRPRPDSPALATGPILWTRRYPHEPGDKSSEAVAVSTGGGSIYVTGFVDTQDHDVDFLTLMLNSDGEVQWQDRYNGPGNDLDRARAIAVDESGNCYVTGESDNGKGNAATRLAGLDFATIKYDRHGARVWVRRYNGPDDGEDSPVKLLLDRSGVYVLGRSWGRSKTGKAGFDYALVKYDLNGRRQWVYRYDGLSGDDIPVDMALDRDGSIYVTGHSISKPASGPERDMLTAKISPQGVEVWTRRYGRNNQTDDSPCAISIDNGGNVYVVGSARGLPGTRDVHRTGCIAIKYDACGRVLSVRGTVEESDRLETVQKAMVSGNGESVACGLATDAKGNPTCRVVARDRSGLPKWSADVTTLAGGDGLSTLAVGTKGVFVCGGLRHPLSEPQFGAYLFDNTGKQIWDSYVDSPIPGGKANAMTTDQETVVVGQTSVDGIGHATVVRFQP